MLKFWFSRLSRCWKEKKWPKMLKISVCCTLYFRNHISHDLHLLCTCMYKRIISPGIFFIFFKILIFGIIKKRGGIRAENGPKRQKIFVCLTLYLRNRTSCDCDVFGARVKWWHLQEIFSFSKTLIFGFWGG